MVDLSSDYVNTEIVCTLAAIGYLEGNEYYKGEDCLECLKDLIRFLRNDDATCTIRRQLGSSQVVEKDLIPILKNCTEDDQDIVEVTFRLLVNLTQPSIICFGKIPTEKIESNHYLEVMSHLQSYKKAFAEKEIMAVIGRELGRRLQLEWDNRREEDTLVIERILLLIRNILHVPADPQAEKRTDEDATVHDQVLWNFHTNGIDDLILYIASSPDESRWCMHALEIISHVLREQKPDVLAKTAAQRTRKEQDEDTRQLDILHQREKAGKTTTSRNGLRHSNFGGTFCMQNLKALNDENKLLYHRPLQNVKKLSFDFGKNPPRKRKRELHAKDAGIERKSTLSVRMFLKDFCNEFLENCYNPLMHIVKDNLKHQRAQQHDESYFLWAMRFFMEFNRHNKFEIAYISETLNVSIFQYILILQTNFFDNFMTDKSDKPNWARRLHLALRAYQELIQHLIAMERFEDEAIKDSAKIIKENVFYVTEYRDIFIIMLKKFDPCFQTRSFLRDLIEGFHVFLKLLEGHCNKKGRIIVQQKKRKAKKKKRTHRAQPVVELTAEQKEQRWMEISADLSSTLQGEDNPVADITNPFDPVSDVPEDEQKTKCLRNIQQCLREESFAKAVVLLRAAREIWQDSSFGENDVDAEGEFMCFLDIFRMDLPVVEELNQEMTVDLEDELTDPEEEEIVAMEVRESEFDISDFLKKLATPTILEPYCWLLNWYQENSSQTNHYIIKMLHRIGVDLKVPAMLFQLSLFVTFRKIFSDPASSKYKELVTFAKYILSKFFALVPTNPAVCAELIFWKSTSECYEITEGYGSLGQRKVKQSGHSWTFEEEEELKRLYEEFKNSDDLVENILNAITNEFRSRRQVVGKLITLRLVENKDILKKKPVSKNAWTEEEENELRTLFEEFKDSEDIVDAIIPNLSNQSRTRRQVINQLVKLNIVEDRKMLRKKRQKKSKKNTTNNEYEDEGSENEEDGYISENSSNQESDEESDEICEEESLSSLFAKLRDSEHAEQLEWIKSRLTSAAEDREEDADWEALPLVTLTEESELALRDKTFQKVLKKIGIVPPSNEQERFWRIPEILSPDLLRKTITDIDTVPEERPPAVQKKRKDPKRQKLAELAEARKSSDKRGERAKKRKDRHGRSPTKKQKKDRAKQLRTSIPDNDQSDSDRSEEDANEKSLFNEFINKQGTSSNKQPQRKRIRMASEESEEDQGVVGLANKNTESKDLEDLAEKAISDNEDSLEDMAGNERDQGEQVEESESSDDDDAFDLPLVRTKKPRHVVLDDEDEDD